MGVTMVRRVAVSGTARSKHKVRAISFWVASTLPPLVITLAGGAHAAEWKITPTVNLTETYTDNVNLVPDAQKQSSFITQVSPGIDFTATGAQAKIKVNYQMQNLYYTGDSNGLKTNHLLNALGSTELVKDLFFLDGTAAITQQNQSPFAAQATDNLNLSNNRVEVRTYSASPALRHTFNQFASAELKYTRDSVATTNSNNAVGNAINSTGDTVAVTVNSGTAFQQLKWGLQYNNQKTAFDNSANSLESTTTGGNLSYYLTPRFSLTGTGGYEKNNYIALDGKSPSGAYWSAGFDWEPTERTSLALNAGRRFYGSSYSLRATERTRSTAWSIAYSEDITTTRQQFLVPGSINTSAYLNSLFLTSIPDPIARQQTVDSFIRSYGLPASLAVPINTFSNQVFLQKGLQASVAITGVSNTVLLSFFNTRRNAQSAALGGNSTDPSLADNSHQVGGSVLWNLVFSPRTSANFNIGYNHSTSPLLIDTNKTFRTALSHDLQPKLKATLEYRHTQQDSNFNLGNYKENALSVFLLLGF
ncbi:TIGR03016 family PEP-CTERM system-associated outer membrane protein [Undibacterium sp. TJN25]|uniref:TIGR03016 family PEP-CTERM system-associated outer membrane protein n=1 Tax=Undibacterium sp. TJN25 TaxID=3413056 RepID=UPI003BF24879